jgi:hypothetical protein
MPISKKVIVLFGPLAVLAAAAMLDAVRPLPLSSDSRGDRLSSARSVPGCAAESPIAACANDSALSKNEPDTRATAIQIFEKPGETILVRLPFRD